MPGRGRHSIAKTEDRRWCDVSYWHLADENRDAPVGPQLDSRPSVIARESALATSEAGRWERSVQYA